MKYRANFLWGYGDDSIESLGYEFANAVTEEYQEACWKELKKSIKSSEWWDLQIEQLKDLAKIMEKRIKELEEKENVPPQSEVETKETENK